MASLMEDLLDTLDQERQIYEQLIPISEKKTSALIQDDLKELEQVTQQEQLLVDRAYMLGKKRESVIENIGIVLNKEPEHLDLTTLVGLLEKQPEEQRRLAVQANPPQPR